MERREGKQRDRAGAGEEGSRGERERGVSTNNSCNSPWTAQQRKESVRCTQTLVSDALRDLCRIQRSELVDGRMQHLGEKCSSTG